MNIRILGNLRLITFGVTTVQCTAALVCDLQKTKREWCWEVSRTDVRHQTNVKGARPAILILHTGTRHLRSKLLVG